METESLTFYYLSQVGFTDAEVERIRATIPRVGGHSLTLIEMHRLRRLVDSHGSGRVSDDAWISVMD